MTVSTKLAAAIDVFTALGWRDATLADAETRPLGTPEQQRVARDGLASGDWGEYGPGPDGAYGWVPWVDVDRHVLAVFAIRVGVDARRAESVLPGSQDLDDETATRILAARGPAFAQQFVAAACRAGRRPWEHDSTVNSGPAVRLVDVHDLPVPAELEYLKDWSAYALAVLTGESHVFPSARGLCAPEVVLRRLPEHVRAGVGSGVPATGPFGSVVAVAVDRGLVAREEALDLVLVALDAAPRPGDRKIWTEVLTGPLAVTDDELAARGDALVTVLAHGDAPVVEALAPRLIATVPDDVLGDVLAVTLPVRTRKAQRSVLDAAARHARPSSDVTEAVAPLVVPLVSNPDRALARAAQGLVEAWGLTDGPGSGGHGAGAFDAGASGTVASGTNGSDEPAVVGLWRATPPVWDVPRFVLEEPTARALTEAAATLVGRPDDAFDVETERFLALANAVARTDRESARTALAGVRPTWVGGLRTVAEWVSGKPNPLLDRLRPTGRGGAQHLVWAPLDAREGAVFQRLGEVPALLSTPTWVDLRIDPADLVGRLREYAEQDARVIEADLYLALTRCDPALATPEVLAALAALDVPVVLQSGAPASFTAGPVAAQYLTDPIVEPPLQVSDGWRYWEPAPLVLPGSLAAFPPRLGGDDGTDSPDLATFPTWGDSTMAAEGASESAGAGLVLRQLARRAAPLTPGLAVNLLGAQRRFHAVAAPDGTTAVLEAWERGLLRPGVAEVRLLDWTQHPTNLAALARACGELAAEGLLSVVWPLLDDLVRASLEGSRLAAGTAECVETMVTLVPEVLAAVTAGSAPSGTTDVPGARALAARPGSSRAVTAARALVGLLPEATAPGTGPVAPAGPVRAVTPFDDIWPADAGTLPAVDDGATITAQWLDAATRSKLLAVDITLPPGSAGPRPAAVRSSPAADGPYRVVKSSFYDLEAEGQCAAASPAAVAAGTTAPNVWLHWDADEGRLVVAPQRNWRGGTDGPLERGTIPPLTTPPLTTSMVAVVLASLCHDDAPTYYVRSIVDEGLIGSASVTAAMRALLPHPDVSPARMVKTLELAPTTLPVLWPVLVESVRHAAGVEGAPPRWLNRVLDVALVLAPTLREAAARGLIPAGSAAWPGLAALTTRRGSATVPTKARALAEAVLSG
ncbi:DUF7824 domain-containing protein [Cellulomonas composti]|uniref:DUF7824 domain-containing protein n=1 Tax=Cellulomonas composti TaxID=266130 RepID=A0A511J7A7_9CELL|nr:hypothetical protein [Cellulomonas composti]GEL93864.1 hypothetical protein CCO02nite_05220 [Cellulomonas composti]